VAVVGPAEASPAEIAAAEVIGRGLAVAGAVVITGGLGGVMEAACRGAHGAGGVTVGLLPGDDPAAANPFVTIPLATGLGHGRDVLVAITADAVIAVAASWGTLAEVALAARHSRPVVTLGKWSLPGDGLTHVSSPEEAVVWALGQRRGG
jgi:uncharacterized protein (TIGR00725 family)